MVIVKRLDTFLLQRFLPVFAMTFFITLFIVLMQFLFRYINDLVGKGLDLSVIAELFMYAAITMVPTALPLAILLASLMTFGNLGEKFELTALKASGISLFRIMRSLIILIAFIAVGAFFFQNDILPMAQTKMWTLMFSIRQKSPEVEIPEKAFYRLSNMSLFVEKKDMESGRLEKIIIYDTSRGMDKVRVILADSGRINFTEDKLSVRIQLYQGEMYEDFQDNVMGTETSRYLPFRRETFSKKTAYLPYDANFNRMDDSTMRQQYIGKNIAELRVAIDSINLRVDSIGYINGLEIKEKPYVSVPYFESKMVNNKPVKAPRKAVAHKPLELDSIFNGPRPESYGTYLNSALTKAQRAKNEYEFKSLTLEEDQKSLRRHEIEMYKKFTLSLACLVFFFIGAPLGAIIKKGGIGMPLVISVMLFIVYYIFDNMGYKMARDGKVNVIAGIWLSTFVMTPLGAFFTYKAVGDTTMFDFDMYGRAWRKLRRRLGHKYHDEKEFRMKEVLMYDVKPIMAIEFIDKALYALDSYIRERDKWWKIKGLINSLPYKKEFRNRLKETTDYLSNTNSHQIIDLLNALPVSLDFRTADEYKKCLHRLRKTCVDELPESERQAYTVDFIEDEPEKPEKKKRVNAKALLKMVKAKIPQIKDKAISILPKKKTDKKEESRDEEKQQ